MVVNNAKLSDGTIDLSLTHLDETGPNPTGTHANNTGSSPGNSTENGVNGDKSSDENPGGE